MFLLIVVSMVIFAIFFWLPRLGGQTSYGLTLGPVADAVRDAAPDVSGLG